MTASVLLLLLASAGAPADQAPWDPAPATSVWQVDAGLQVANPAVLEQGLATGVSGQLQRRWGEGPFILAGSASWGLAAGSNPAWVVSHHQTVATAGAGATFQVGEGRVWGHAGGGGILLYEVLDRQQGRRIEDAGVPGASEQGWAAGPVAYAEVGVALDLRWGFRASLAAGPRFSLVRVGEERRARLGGFCGLGVAYGF